MATARVGMATISCIYCKTQLSYPPNSVYIQCPKCTNTMNPHAPNMNYMNCVGCGTLLSHPPSSLTIQCPKCLVIMDITMPINMAGPQNMQPHRQIMQQSQQHQQHQQQQQYAQSGMMQQQMAQGTGPVAGAAAGKIKKKRKDPAAPKRASNAYMIYCKERRARLKEERPDLPFGKLGAKLGEMWRLMSKEEKKPYEDRAIRDRERYKREMHTYGPVEDEDGGAAGAGKRSKFEPDSSYNGGGFLGGEQTLGGGDDDNDDDEEDDDGAHGEMSQEQYHQQLQMAAMQQLQMESLQQSSQNDAEAAQTAQVKDEEEQPAGAEALPEAEAEADAADVTPEAD